MNRFLGWFLPIGIALGICGWLLCSCYKGNPPWPVDPTQPSKARLDGGAPFQKSL